jgi:hypothetical protein
MTEQPDGSALERSAFRRPVSMLARIDAKHRGTPLITAKRAGWTENIGPTARRRAGWRELRHLDQLSEALNPKSF